MFTKDYLENGIPVVIERLKNFRSIIIGIWIKVGSRKEQPDKNGISHFIEHMFFKGTTKRSSKDISIEIDSIGGDLNAFTSREQTVFYVKVLDEYVDKGIELLADIFNNSVLQEKDIEKEKNIAVDEIRLVEDSPDEYIHDLFNQTIWGNIGLGQPVLGSANTVKAITRTKLLSHIEKHYGILDIVIACAGNLEQDPIIKKLNKHLGYIKRKKGNEESFAQTSFESKIKIFQKDLSETHICLGVEGLPVSSKDRYAMAVVNSILGSSVSSRLFHKIREEKAYAYSIHSFTSSYIDTGLWAVYAGTSKDKAIEVINLIIKEMKELTGSLLPSEIRRAKDQIKGNLILGMESTSSRMQHIAMQEIYFGRHFAIAEIIKSIENVNIKQVKDLTQTLINNGKMSLVVLGAAIEKDFIGLI